MAKILIAGATGLIGSEFVRQAISAGHSVAAICRRESQGKLPSGAHAVLADLQNPLELLSALPREKFDAVLYLAQGDDHNSFPENASNAVAINLWAPIALCQFACETGSGRFLYGSSGGICGPMPDGAITEKHKPQATSELSFYLATKARCEELLHAFMPRIPVTLLRYFFVYGKEQKSHFLFQKLANRIRASDAIPLAQGQGPRFNPIHAQDAAYLTLSACFASYDGVINIAGPEPVSLFDVVSQIGRRLGVSPICEATAGDIPNFVASTALMREVLGAARINLADGMQMTF